MVLNDGPYSKSLQSKIVSTCMLMCQGLKLQAVTFKIKEIKNMKMQLVLYRSWF